MNGKKKTEARILSQQMIAENIYDLWIASDMAEKAKAGQFIGIYPKDASRLLPRPVSICEADKEKGALRLVYRIAGKGTEEFAGWKEGEQISILGLLGNGFPALHDIWESDREKKKVVLMGGGIGIPPMLQLAREIISEGNRADIIAGDRDGQLFLKEDLEKYGTVFAATEDGSAGTQGNVLTVMEQRQLEADVIMACGPMPMLLAIKRYAQEKKIPAYLSLEERMACGVGACLGCVCKTTHKDPHSHVNNAIICTDGPVFEAGEVDI